MEELDSGMSFFDANAFIGRHENPYVPSPFTADSAVNVCQSEYGPGEMLVFHAAAVRYDATYGNQILVEEARDKRCLALVWIALPDHVEDENRTRTFIDDLRKHNVKAVKIYPRTHNFTLSIRCMDGLLSYLNETQMPLLADQSEIAWEEIDATLRRFPKLPFILTSVNYRLGRFVEPLLKQHHNLYLEISRYQVHRGLEHLCGRCGSERLLFGSGLPLFSPEPIMMMIVSAGISEQDKKNIAGDNMRRLLREAA